MSDILFPYYERELLFIRQLAQDFARRYPSAAGRLLLEPNRSADPHVERLIEAFALLSGRVQHRLDDEFPELTDALLNVLYPHFLAPVPSLAIVQFDLDPARGQLPQGFKIPRGSRMRTPPVQDKQCLFQTTYPVTLWPIQIREALWQTPPFPPGLPVPARTAAALRLSFETVAGQKFAGLALDSLRLFLFGDNQVVPYLYEYLFNNAIQVVFRDPRGILPPVMLDPADCLKQVGFEKDEGLLPYPERSFLGYRLLTEFFAFPSKFWFLDLEGWQKVARAGFQDKCEVVIFFSRTLKSLEQGIEASTFRLGATPIINLFDQVAEPVALTHTRHEYLVVPEVAHPFGLEIYSIDGVSSTDPNTSRTTEYQPFYSFRHGQDQDNLRTFWYASRRASRVENDRGTDMYLSLVDLDFSPRAPADSSLLVRTTCTNRDLPLQLQVVGEQLYFQLDIPAPLQRVRCLRMPTSPLRPPSRRGGYWRLLSHLSLNHLSIGDEREGAAALQEILRLYDFSDPEAGQQQLAAVNRQMVEGLLSVESKRAVARLPGEVGAGFCRGLEITVEFDEPKYIGTGVFLFASILERFLGLYASINSFTRMAARTKQGEGIFKKWPPRAGDLPLI